MAAVRETVETVGEVEKYKYGFTTDIESDKAPLGLTEETVRFISAKKNEPDWLLEWRLAAFRRWLTMDEPKWAKVSYPPIDFQDAYYYAAPKQSAKLNSLDEVDPKLLETYQKLGIPLTEQKMLAGVAVDAVFDSVSVVTTFKEKLREVGVIFCPMSEAVRDHPELVQKYLGSVVPTSDNFYATLNSAVFSEGSFVYIPEGVRCPMELSTYFRINEKQTGQFERTLIIADKGSYVSYLEGCTGRSATRTSFMRRSSNLSRWKMPNKLTVRTGIRAMKTARVASTISSPSGDCRGANRKYHGPRSRQLRHHLEISERILRGDNSRANLFDRDFERAPAGRQRHQDDPSRPQYVEPYRLKGISAGRSSNTYRGLVSASQGENVRNFTQCDSLLIGDRCSAHTVPYIETKTRVRCWSTRRRHRKSAKTDEHCRQRGIGEEEAVALIVNGFAATCCSNCRWNSRRGLLVGISLEGSVG